MLLSIRAMNAVEAAAFVWLCVRAIRVWRRYRESSNARLAVTLGLLAVVSVLGVVNQLESNSIRALGLMGLVGFIASGYSFMLYRHAFIPVSRRMRAVVAAAGAIAIGLGLGIRWPTQPDARLSNLQYIALLIIIGGWFVAVIDPVVSFWRASRGRPSVQRARLRALSFGFGGFVVLLFVAMIVARSGQHPVIGVGFQAFSLALMPVLAVAVSPPRWVRRMWRAHEEEAISTALHDLILFAPDQQTLARRALTSAMELFGADGGWIAGPDGEIVASEAFDPAWLERIGGAPQEPQLVRLGHNRYAVVVAVAWGAGAGVMAVVSGPFTPLFGPQDLRDLAGYATMVSVSIERIRLTMKLDEQRALYEVLHRSVGDLGEGIIVADEAG
ncbi:MAG: hypothetical protein ABR552_05860, partial [Actinomycetota bacterium]